MNDLPAHCRWHLAALFAAGASGALASAARADVTAAHYLGPDNFGYVITHMPDFDQRRGAMGSIPGLPNNGAMYCAPTSALNVLGYIANHGFPDVPPEEHAWQAPATYNYVTGSLAFLGFQMGTSPTNGTGGIGMRDGAALWAGDRFTVDLYYSSGSYAPSLAELTQSAVGGSLIACCYGFYNQVGNFEGVPILDRTGGHCVTMTRATGGIFTQSIRVRDPADSTNLFNQSTFTDRLFDVVPRQVIVGTNVRTMANFVVPGNQTSGAYLDGYLAFRPKAGYALTDTQIEIKPLRPYELVGSPPTSNAIVSATGENIFDWIVGPDRNAVYYLTRNAAGQYLLYCANIHTEEHIPFDIPLPGPGPVVVGRNRALYMAQDGFLGMYPLDPLNPVLLGSTDLPGDIVGDPMVYNDKTDQLVAFDVDESALYVVPADLKGSASVYTLPCLITGPSSMAWDPTADASYWVTSESSNQLFRVTLPVGSPIATCKAFSFDKLVAPTSVDVDDQGHLHVADAGSWWELEIVDEANCLLGAVEDSLFLGLGVGKTLHINRSRTNWDPALHEGPAWRNVLPTEFGLGIPECPADITGVMALVPDGSVDSLDFLLLVSEWGAACPGTCTADITGPAPLEPDGAVDALDFLLMLAQWGSPGDC